MVIYLERLKRALSTERGLCLTFSSGDREESLEVSREAADQILQALQVVTSDAAREEPMTLTVLGHQIVRKPEAYGLRLRTQEFGEVVFSVPPAILRRLIIDLTHLASSSPALQTFGSGDATGQPRGKLGARHS
jgi:hypothetical protein